MSRSVEVWRALNAIESRSFQYGSTDCCQFAREIVQQITGREIEAPTYGSESEADDIVEGFGGYQKMISALLDQEPSPIDSLRTGDPVLLEVGGQPIVGVMFANGVALKTKQRITSVSAKHVRAGWHSEAKNG